MRGDQFMLPILELNLPGKSLRTLGRDVLAVLDLYAKFNMFSAYRDDLGRQNLRVSSAKPVFPNFLIHPRMRWILGPSFK